MPKKQTESEKRFDRGTEFDFFAMNERHDEKQPDNDVATNDGSVVETLDTAFHDVHGNSEGENISGSNRTDYYETRSNNKSDTQEELDARQRPRQ